MAKQQAKPLKPRDIQGLKYLDRLMPLLDQLHEVGCQRDKAGNEKVRVERNDAISYLFRGKVAAESSRAGAAY